MEVLNQETHLSRQNLAKSRWRIFQGLIDSIAVFGPHPRRFAFQRDARLVIAPPDALNSTTRPYPGRFAARPSPCGAIGSERTRCPVASKMAFPTAGAIPMMGHSPAPADGRSLRSTSTLSMTGMSANRGTR